MPDYNPGDLELHLREQQDAVAVSVPIPPAGTLAHIAAVYAEGAGAFYRIAEAADIIDPIPWPGLPPRAVRRISLSAYDEVRLPDTGVL